MVYNYKKQRSPIVPMYTILGTSDGVPEKNGEDTSASKQQIRKIEDTPAPNSYSLPQMVGNTTQSNKRQAPCYSLTGRPKVATFCEDLARTPGPAAYSITDPNVFKDKAPHYSMASRDFMPSDNTKKPGPGTHSPEYVYLHKWRPPSYSFGIRHSEYLAPLIVEALD